MPEQPETFEAIAVIGMTGRFPGAGTIDEFWDNLCAGRVSIGRFSAGELAAAGVPARLREDPRYVPARGVLGDADHFDAGYFAFSPREAELTDPQQRLFLECAEEALQDAGYDSQRVGRPVGVFAGCTASTYQQVIREFEADTPPDDIGVRIGNDVDFLATRAAYKLNLTGPAVTVQSACSTGLVAVHLACQSLLDGECAMAVAGAASIQYPERVGYTYEPASICSPDGHCRPFDAAARGTVSGNGVGVVVLKPLADAVADGDPIRAVILGTATNNDGSAKIGFTAPSVRGQRAVIRQAQAAAGIDPAGIGYVEAHGTGTPLGDPIEVEALTQAFGAGSGQPCLLGSVKANIGHLDAAAGLVGLLKTVLVVEHGLIPPTPHFSTPNPNAKLAGGPFTVAAELTPWPHWPGPRRAAVSAFGVGGTNAHAVVGEHPVPAGEPDGRWQLIPLSARDGDTLRRFRARLAEHLTARPDLALGDVAHTMQLGRRELGHRLAIVARDGSDLSTMDKSMIAHGVTLPHPPSVAFTFPGQGTEFCGMAGRLAAEFPTFAGHLDECLAAMAGVDLAGVQLADFLLGEPEETRSPVDTELAQPALFAVQYALARLWISWGVTPSCLLGHSLGEFTAATVSGVFSLADAARMVALRGRLVQTAPEGAMVAVFAGVERVEPLLPDGVSPAAVNSPRATVVSGPVDRVEAVTRRLTEAGLRVRRLTSRRAFHSPLLAEAGERLAAAVAGCRLGKPDIPFVSGVSGDWITTEQATDPAYWASQLCRPVRFADGVSRLHAAEVDLVLEVGHGRTLTTLTRDGLPAGRLPRLVVGLPGGDADPSALLRAAGELWTTGAQLDWTAMQVGRQRRRLRLPTYPFDRSRYTVLPGAAGEEVHARPDLEVDYQAPRNGLEARLVEIFADVLGVEKPGVDDSFFDLGGDSLIAVRLLARVHGHYGLDLPGEAFFGQPTVAGLGELLGTALEESVASMDAAQVAALLGELEGSHDDD